MWSKGNYVHMKDFVRDAHKFGFTHIELNSILTPEMLQQLLETSVIKVSSVHCPCPVTYASNGMWATELSLSALDYQTRKEAVEFGKKTIDIASKVGAQAVVIHAGRVDIESASEQRLRLFYKEGVVSSKEFDQTKELFIKERNAKSPAHLEAAKESINTLLEYASATSILIGLENRVHFYEIPTLDEMRDLLEEFDGRKIGYWHDVGHAEIFSRLGLIPHHEWLSCLGPKIIGAHLHDVIGIQDHYVPGVGTLNWDLVRHHLPQEAIRVCEIGEWNDPSNIEFVIPFLTRKGITGF